MRFSPLQWLVIATSSLLVIGYPKNVSSRFVIGIGIVLNDASLSRSTGFSSIVISPLLVVGVLVTGSLLLVIGVLLLGRASTFPVGISFLPAALVNRRSFAAATIFMADVIFRVFFTLPMRSRRSLRLAMLF